jgi:hypothetical protein
MAGGEEAFAEVAGHDFFLVADGGQVDAGIPAKEYIDVRRYMAHQVLGVWSLALAPQEWLKQLGDAIGFHVAQVDFRL